jgi:hypothetical protein
MARIVARCPICKATASVDNQKKTFKCPICRNTSRLESCEVVVPPEVDNEYHGKWFNNHLFLGIFTILTGIFGVDFFVKKKIKHGILSVLIFWTGASAILGIFRGLEILGLEDSEIEEFYSKY